jgi:hypothetical protein
VISLICVDCDYVAVETVVEVMGCVVVVMIDVAQHVQVNVVVAICYASVPSVAVVMNCHYGDERTGYGVVTDCAVLNGADVLNLISTLIGVDSQISCISLVSVTFVSATLLNSTLTFSWSPVATDYVWHWPGATTSLDS